MIEKFAAWLRGLAGKDKPDEPAQPAAVTLFLYLTLSNGDGLYTRIRAAGDRIADPDWAEKAMEGTREYLETNHNIRITSCRLLTYDQYMKGVSACPDPEPEKLPIEQEN